MWEIAVAVVSVGRIGLNLNVFDRSVVVCCRFLSVATAITDNAQTSVSGQRQNAKVESG